MALISRLVLFPPLLTVISPFPHPVHEKGTKQPRKGAGGPLSGQQERQVGMASSGTQPSDTGEKEPSVMLGNECKLHWGAQRCLGLLTQGSPL